MYCPYCNSSKFTRTNTQDMEDGRVYRRNLCLSCGKRFSSYEVYVPMGETVVPRMFRRNNVKLKRRGKDEIIYKSDD